MNLSWYKHLSDVMVVMKSEIVRWLALLMIVVVAFKSVIYEYYQLIASEKGLNIQLIAILFSVLLVGMSISSYVFSKYRVTKYGLVIAWVSLIVVSIYGLALDGYAAVFVNLTILYASLKYIDLYLNLSIQNRIESSKRASILSSANSIGQLAFLGFAAVIYFLFDNLGVTGAISLTAVPLVALGIVEILRILKQGTNGNVNQKSIVS